MNDHEYVDLPPLAAANLEQVPSLGSGTHCVFGLEILTESTPVPKNLFRAVLFAHTLAYSCGALSGLKVTSGTVVTPYPTVCSAPLPT